MGGINSGRRPDVWEQRVQVEDALVLDIPLLRAHGALSTGTKGLLTWKERPSTVEFAARPSGRILLHYGRREHAYFQVITIEHIPLHWHHGTFRLALVCMQCGRRGYKLYLGRTPYFLCRRCQDLIYELQTVHYGSLCHVIVATAREERQYYAAWRKHEDQRTKKSRRRKE